MPANKQSDLFRRASRRVPVPWVFVLAYLVGAGIEKLAFGHTYLRSNRFVPVAGGVIFALGAALAAWGWLIFHQQRTTRVPGETSTTFVMWGPYRFTRNPMYVGLSVAYVGEAVILHQLIPIVLLPAVIAYLNQIVIPIEEKCLQDAFGSEYARYRNRVRRWL